MVVTIIGIWLGYHLNWIRQRHALLEEPNVTASFIPMWRAPSMSLGLLGERGVNSVFLQYSGWLGIAWSESDEARRKRASRLFPEAKVRVWGGTIPYPDDPGTSALP